MKQYEGNYKRVLCVCTANMLRSPTAAYVLSLAPFRFNTRSAGVHPCALIRVTPALLSWCEEVVCMEQEHALEVTAIMKENDITDKSLFVLGIPDDYDFRDTLLMEMIANRYTEMSAFKFA